MSSSTTRLMTFAEFEQLPNPKFGHYELHHGELIEVAPPKKGHSAVQRRLSFLLDPLAREVGVVCPELGYRPAPEYEYWRADVAFVSKERWDQTPSDGYLEGPPELVIEVLSPSNTAAEIRQKENVCLENGAREFWLVDMDKREVEVSTNGGHTITYKSGRQIPLFFAPDTTLAVDLIFT